ncbi:MAG: hypothetical protein WCX12_01805 [Candidatus Paceibacterota bacterium]
MHNWTVDEEKLKANKDRYLIWRLEQLANFGLDGEKIKASDLRNFWLDIDIDPKRKEFLNLILNS